MEAFLSINTTMKRRTLEQKQRAQHHRQQQLTYSFSDRDNHTPDVAEPVKHLGESDQKLIFADLRKTAIVVMIMFVALFVLYVKMR